MPWHCKLQASLAFMVAFLGRIVARAFVEPLLVESLFQKHADKAHRRQKCACYRRTARVEHQAELASVEEQIAGTGTDWDAETLDSQEAGLVFFDGSCQHLHNTAICFHDGRCHICHTQAT